MIKKITSFVLVIVIIASFAPVTALANNDILENNIAKFDTLPTNEAALALLKLPYPGIESDHPEIIAKALDITSGLETDYEKARAIHIWVANNTWYNNDLANALNDPKNETVVFSRIEAFAPIESECALSVLRNQRAICVGYANLTVALLRATEIPSTIAFGNEHEWYHAYVDGKWIIGDSTWDSYNLFENGILSPRKNGGTDWFNVSIKDLSLSSYHEMDTNNYMFLLFTNAFHTTTEKTVISTTLTISRTEILLTTVTENRTGFTTEIIESKDLLPVSPQIINGRTMVPMRVIFEALGAQVIWNGNTRTVTGIKSDTIIVLIIGNEVATINGQSQTLDQAAVVIDGSTLVPLRFVGEALDAEVQWVG